MRAGRGREGSTLPSCHYRCLPPPPRLTAVPLFLLLIGLLGHRPAAPVPLFPVALPSPTHSLLGKQRNGLDRRDLAGPGWSACSLGPASDSQACGWRSCLHRCLVWEVVLAREWQKMEA